MKKTILLISTIILGGALIAMAQVEIPEPELEADTLHNENMQIADKIDAGAETSQLITVFTRGDTSATTTIEASFDYRGETLSISVNMDGYNNCRAGMWGTSTEAWCKKRLNYQINQNMKWAKESLDSRLNVPTDYSAEISDKDL